MSQLVGRDPVIEVAVAGLLPALLHVALQRYLAPAARAQAVSLSQARVRVPGARTSALRSAARRAFGREECFFFCLLTRHLPSLALLAAGHAGLLSGRPWRD